MKVLRRIITLAMTFMLCMSGMGCKDTVQIKKEFTEPKANGTIEWYEELPAAKFSEHAETVDVISLSGYSADISATIQSLMAIVNAEKPRIAIAENGNVDWFKTLNIKYTLFTNPYELMDKYKQYVTKVVIYDSTALHTVNLACTYAGTQGAIVSTFTGYTVLASRGYEIEILADYRGMFNNADKAKEKRDIYTYMYDNYYELCTRRMITSLAPDMTLSLRDYAMAAKSAIVFLNFDSADRDLVDMFFGKVTSGNGSVWGWAPNGDEGGLVQAASRNGLYVWGSDHSKSLSFFASRQAETPKLEVASVDEYLNKDGSVIPYVYAAIGVSDGDNLQYMQGAMYSWFNNSRRNDPKMPPLTWTINPAASDIIPMIYNYYIDNKLPSDGFMTGPSGIGYFYPRDMYNDEAQRDSMLNFYKATDRYLVKTGINTISTWFNGMADVAIPTEYMQLIAPSLPHASGMMFQRNMDSTAQGDILFGGWNDPYNDNPVSNFTSEIKIAHGLYASANGETPSYVAVQAVPWDGDMLGHIITIAENARNFTVSGKPTMAGKDVIKFITVDQLIQLQRIEKGLTKIRV